MRAWNAIDNIVFFISFIYIFVFWLGVIWLAERMEHTSLRSHSSDRIWIISNLSTVMRSLSILMVNIKSPSNRATTKTTTTTKLSSLSSLCEPTYLSVEIPAFLWSFIWCCHWFLSPKSQIPIKILHTNWQTSFLINKLTSRFKFASKSWETYLWERKKKHK